MTGPRNNRRGGRGMYPKTGKLQHKSGKIRYILPEYLEATEIQALIRSAPHAKAKLLMTFQWRAGLRISEALAIKASDITLDGDRPTIHVRQGKGRRDRLVPIHPKLVDAIQTAMAFGDFRRGPFFTVNRTTAWRWVKTALRRATELGSIQPGKYVGTHTLRHSAARHWLAHGIPINVAQKWLGHSSLQVTLRYLELLPDPAGDIARIP